MKVCLMPSGGNKGLFTRYTREASRTPMPNDCFVYMRQFGKQRHIIALNFSGNEQQVHLPKIGPTRVLLSTHLDREESLDLASLRLRGDEGCIIEVGDTRA